MSTPNAMDLDAALMTFWKLENAIRKWRVEVEFTKKYRENCPRKPIDESYDLEFLVTPLFIDLRNLLMLIKSNSKHFNDAIANDEGDEDEMPPLEYAQNYNGP